MNRIAYFFYYLGMKITISSGKNELGMAAASEAAANIVKAIDQKGQASIILTTGASQFEVLDHLTGQPDVDWSKVTMFHLDEYVGLSDQHPASLRKYLKERFINRLSSLYGYYLIDGSYPFPKEECRRIGDIIRRHPIDVALVGIGENAHLALNDPPADFETDEPYIVVKLDETCRRQRVREGWFKTLEGVPVRAISMSIKHIMKSGTIICSVPDQRKAEAVKNCLERPVSDQFPASILQQHSDCYLFLDRDSASLLSGRYA